uniref:Uncharacterized protein n=1 Tax=Sphaerodactylus townsendi TaxID=933632 RepID=A0ACB8EGT1_9SAUR
MCALERNKNQAVDDNAVTCFLGLSLQEGIPAETRQMAIGMGSHVGSHITSTKEPFAARELRVADPWAKGYAKINFLWLVFKYKWVHSQRTFTTET